MNWESNNKILIVDDDPNMRVTLKDILEEESYLVTTAENGEEAIELCKVIERIAQKKAFDDNKKPNNKEFKYYDNKKEKIPGLYFGR